MMITENSYLLAHHLPNAQLRINSDAGHGFLDQYPEQFADHVNAFLNGGSRTMTAIIDTRPGDPFVLEFVEQSTPERGNGARCGSACSSRE